jgi:protein-L-isoaspartate O-methyltransferase
MKQFIRYFLKKIIELVGYNRVKSFINNLYSDIPDYSGEAFHINHDGIEFKMRFGERKLDYAIKQRIQGKREPVTLALLKAIADTGDHILEIGGCYGYFTTILSYLVGEEGKILSLEGTSDNCLILKDK